MAMMIPILSGSKMTFRPGPSTNQLIIRMIRWTLMEIGAGQFSSQRTKIQTLTDKCLNTANSKTLVILSCAAVQPVMMDLSRVTCWKDSGPISASTEIITASNSFLALLATRDSLTLWIQPNELSVSASHSSNSITLTRNIPMAKATSQQALMLLMLVALGWNQTPS